MTTILGIIVFSIFMKVLPFALVGFILKGWKPYLMPLALTLVAIFVFGYWTFGWFSLPLDYFLALLGYSIGTKIRTGKSSIDQSPSNEPEGQLSFLKGGE